MPTYLEISSLTNPKITELSNLHNKKNRYEQKLFLIEGYHLVEEAKKHSSLEYILTTSVNDFDKYEIGGYLVNDKIIAKLSTTITNQEIIGVCKMLEEDLRTLTKYQKIVLLDNINDPGNLGTIIRTCAALGIEAIVASLQTVDLYNEKVIRSTQGALFKIPFLKMPLELAIQELKSNQVTVLGTSLNSQKPLTHLPTYQKWAIVFGNEANGISQEILALVDETFYIPMQRDVESLNVGVACGIIVYHLIND